MRLIHARSLTLETFDDDSQRPRYAILSHRWLHGREILLRDFLNRCKEEDDDVELEGWSKIKKCCARALEDDLEYVWVDTCCINKDSSAELSEAINSMFIWYHQADRCYAYLHDVNLEHDIPWTVQFKSSVWFLRAWTLQELIAPSRLDFFDREWRKLGSRSSLADQVSQASGIHTSVFGQSPPDLGTWSVAQRMSWGSRRVATRTEDIAYSLLGIFDVSMPLLYGEGQKAFLRLQEEIIRRTYDHSIFAWSGYSNLNFDSDSECETSCELTGMLASSPTQFLCDGNVISRESDSSIPYSLTNLGLQIPLQITPWGPNLYLAALNCFRGSIDQIGVHQIGIFLLKKTSGQVGTFRVILNGRSCAKWDWAHATSLTNWVDTFDGGLHAVTDHSRLVTIGTYIGSLDKVHLKQALYRSNVRITIKARSLKDYDQPEPMLICRELTEKPTSFPRTEFLSSFTTGRTSGFHLGYNDWNIINFVGPEVSRYGILCIILYPLGSRCINAIKLGMDANLDPVCILADESNKETARNTPQLDRSGSATNYLPLEETHKDFWQWHCLEEENWFHYDKRLPLPLREHPPFLNQGLWTMKGKRGECSSFWLPLGEGDGRHSVVIKMNFERENSWTFSIEWD